MSELRIEDLSRPGLQPVSLTIAPAQCVCISGPSGSGKSLLLRAIADLDPHTGHVSLDGVACESMRAPHWRRQVGLLPAESQWWYETVGEHFTQADEATLAHLGFEPQVLQWQLSRCSTGERQRLAIVRMLALHPKVLLLDEPTASLDQANVEQVESLLAQYREQQQAAVLWISHDTRQIDRVCQRQYRMHTGGTLQELS